MSESFVGLCRIEEYAPKFKDSFRELNEAWIRQYFKIEKEDLKALENPEAYILDRGGSIFVATIEGRAVGVCALMKRVDLDAYELAKMAVSPEVQGRNIGFLLGLSVIEKARELKAKRVYLESNTILKPAIRLYEKLGFQKIHGAPSPYERCDIQMELILD